MSGSTSSFVLHPFYRSNARALKDRERLSLYIEQDRTLKLLQNKSLSTSSSPSRQRWVSRCIYLSSISISLTM